MVKSVYNIGDEYQQMRLNYHYFLENGGKEENYPYPKYYNCTIKYITDVGSFILEINETIDDDSFEMCMFSGEDIKKIFSDFEGDDDKEYCVMYYDNSPFFM